MHDRATIATLSHDQLIEMVMKLVEENAALRQRIDELERRGKRQAAPFSKGEKKANPKPPGRKQGAGEDRLVVARSATEQRRERSNGQRTRLAE